MHFDSTLEDSLHRLCQDFSIEVTPNDLPQPKYLAKHLESVAGNNPGRGVRAFISHLLHDDIRWSLETATAMHKLGIHAVPHIAVRRYRSVEHVQQTLEQFKEYADIHEIMLIAGDTPQPQGTIRDCLDFFEQEGLFRVQQAVPLKRIWFGVYPEGHPNISQRELDDAYATKIKYCQAVELPCRFISQLSFTPAPLIRWLNTTDLKQQLVHTGVFVHTTYATARSLARLVGTKSAQAFLQEYQEARRPDLLYGHSTLRALAEACQQNQDCAQTVGGLHFLSLGFLDSVLQFALQLQKKISHSC